MMAGDNVVVAPEEGEVVLRGGFGVVRKIPAATSGAISIVEHPLEPGALAAPPHTYADTDEYSFVIEGEIGVLMVGNLPCHGRLLRHQAARHPPYLLERRA